MRTLFTVSGWPAHYFPMVPLGWAMQAAGHEVRVACPPNQAGPIRSAGLVPVPVLGDLDMSFLSRFANLAAAHAGAWPYPWAPMHPDTGEPVDLSTFDFDGYADYAKRRIAMQSKAGFAAAVELARQFRPDLVVHDRLSADGLLAAKVLGVPAAAYLWGPVGTDEADPGAVPIAGGLYPGLSTPRRGRVDRRRDHARDRPVPAGAYSTDPWPTARRALPAVQRPWRAASAGPAGRPAPSLSGVEQFDEPDVRAGRLSGSDDRPRARRARHRGRCCPRTPTTRPRCGTCPAWPICPTGSGCWTRLRCTCCWRGVLRWSIMAAPVAR